jgi:hypothetical protein
VCPFAWLTSKWARMVQAQRDHTAGWRFHLAADDQPGRGLRQPFPAGIPSGHAAGLKLPRVAAWTRAQHSRDSVGPRYAAVGARLFDTASDSGHADGGYRGARTFLAPSSPRQACQPNWMTPSKTLLPMPESARRPAKHSPCQARMPGRRSSSSSPRPTLRSSAQADWERTVPHCPGRDTADLARPMRGIMM